MSSSEAQQASDFSLAVGRWGEEMVYHWLLDEANGEGAVTWINKDGNCTDPFDISTE